MMLYYSNGETLEILAYLFWHGLLVLGAAHMEAAWQAAFDGDIKEDPVF